MKKKTALLFFVMFVLLVPTAYSQPSIQWSMVFSETRQYDPSCFPGAPGTPFYNGYPYWFMIAVAALTEPATEPVYLASTPTGNYELTFYPGINQYVGVFFDMQTPAWGGPFPSPGPQWEDQSYTFSVGLATQDFYIPAGALRQIPMPRVEISGSIHPTISWNPVPFAMEYRVDIFGLNAQGYPDTNNLLFSSGPISAPTYTYTGDLFSDGAAYAFRILAIERPESPSHAILNRSAFYTLHSAEASPDIMANGRDECLVKTTQPVDITVALDPGVDSGQVCDWWIGAYTPFGIYWLGPGLTWAPSNAPVSVGQFGLFNLTPTSLLNMPLPVGPYGFLFILDDIPNGILDSIRWFDYATVLSQP